MKTGAKTELIIRGKELWNSNKQKFDNKGTAAWAVIFLTS